ncbi:MAG: class I SAM-dependent methyltransferase [Thermoproteota archaeon]
MSYRVFEQFSEDYDSWYSQHSEVLESEIRAIKALDLKGLGLDIGVGTGIFASSTKVQIGIDVSNQMLRTAVKRGIQVIRALAEFLPFPDKMFDYVLMTVTLCFLDDPETVLKEIYRILKPSGVLAVCIIVRDSSWGQLYVEKAKQGHRFYRYARFYSLLELEELLEKHSFKIVDYKSTLTYPPSSTPVVEDPKNDPHQGSFLCVKTIKR